MGAGYDDWLFSGCVCVCAYIVVCVGLWSSLLKLGARLLLFVLVVGLVRLAACYRIRLSVDLHLALCALHF